MSLKNLQEISSLVTKMTKTNRFLKLEEQDGAVLKYRQLIQGLSENSWSDEAEAEAELYGSKRGNKTFDMLKSRAKDQLLDQIFLLDTQKTFKSSYDKAFYLTCKNLLSGVILFSQGRLNSGTSQLKLTIKSARKYQFFDLELVALRIMRNQSGFRGNRHSFESFNQRIKTVIGLIEADLKADELNQELILEIVNKVSLDQEWLSRVKQNYNQLRELVKTHDSFTTRTNMCRVGIRYFDSIHDYKSAINLATEYENYLNNNPHLIQISRLGEMSIQKLYCALHLRDYVNGTEYANSCFDFFNHGTINWLIFLEYYFLLCLHTGNYDKALEIYDNVISHPKFESYNPQNKEKWKIFEAFLAYSGKDKTKSSKKFNIPKFINEVPLFSKDKAGYNFSIIIAQIILSIKIGDFESIVSKAEAIKLYASRYIKKDKNPRSYYFIKMLQVMIKYDFDGLKTEQISNKFFIKLKESHLGEQSELESLEVIPYDILWPELIELLKSRN